jgi:hypothetical protein
MELHQAAAFELTVFGTCGRIAVLLGRVMTFSAGRRNRRVPISDSLQRKLSVYALAAGAAGVGALTSSYPAEGEVVYTPAHQVLGRNQTYAIDLNHDGITDYTLDNSFFQDGRGSSYRAADLNVTSTAGKIVCSSEGYAAAALQKGAKIGPKDGFAAACSVMAERLGEGSFGTYSFGDWFNVSDKYLGLRFEIQGQVHYGWARLTVKWNNAYWIVATLSGFAYETDADKPIRAGDEGHNAAETSGSAPVSAVELPRKPCLGVLSLGSLGLATSQH